MSLLTSAKTTVVVLLFVMLSPALKSQVFEEGNAFASIGYGFPNFTNTWFKLIAIGTEENYSNSAFGPLHAKFEYALTDKLGLGLSVNFATAKGQWDETTSEYNTTTGMYEENTYTETLRLTSWNALARINWHWVDHDKVDFYTGIGIGYNSNKFNYTSTDPDFDEETEMEEVNQLVNLVPIGYETTLGLRYLFSDNLGAYMELGWSKSLMQIGVVGRF